MTDNKDDTGKAPPRPGEGPKRPYATIDLQATEVGGKARGEGASSATGGPARPEARQQALPPPGAGRTAGERFRFTERLATARGWSARAAQSNTFLSHVAAGVAGAVLTLLAATLFGLFAGGSGGDRSAPEVAKRLAVLEQAVKQRTPPGEVTAKLAATDARVASLEDRARAIAALGDAQAKLAADTKALQARVGAPELTERLGKLETALAASSAVDQSSGSTQAAALAAKLTELEKLAGKAGEAAQSASAHADRELAVIKTEAGRLAQRIDALRGEVEERLKGAAKTAELAPVTSRLAAFEHDLQGFLKSEGERNSNARRVLLSLEIANLKRAMDRGDRYAVELEAVKKAAAGTLDLASLERHMLEGVPTLPALAKEFRRVANAAVDAEAEPPDASVLDKLIAGAKGIVRVRKADHGAADMGAEAIVGRMESALKDGRIGEVLAQGKKLPPKAALVAEPWLRRLEARHAIDQAVADIDSQLKASLGALRVPAAEPKR